MGKKGFYANLDEQTHKRLKIFALANDMTMTETLEYLINEHCRLGKDNGKQDYIDVATQEALDWEDDDI